MNVELFSPVGLGVIVWVVAVSLLVMTHVKEARDEFGYIELATRFFATTVVIVIPVLIFLKG